MSSRIMDRNQREFVPAAGRDMYLPLYDPCVKLLGFDRARQQLVAQANIKTNDHVLDIGCGTGTFVVFLKRRHVGVNVVGIDPDPKALHRAKKKVKRAGVSVQLDQGFADDLPYTNKSFDRVFSSFMLHHLEKEERDKTLEEVSRVLKPGGSFHLLDFIAEHDAPGYVERLMHSHALMTHNTDEHILEQMRRAGLKNAEKVKESSMLFGLLRIAYYRAGV